MRVFAVDWSGRLRNPGAAIWLAEAGDGGIVRLEGGRDRHELTRHLIEEAERDPELVVGLDFPFSFPRWFVEEHAGSAFDFWRVAGQLGEHWLAECKPPFWRARGLTPLPPDRAFRATDRSLTVGGIRPESVFKLVGAAQVGPGSIRGMPALEQLRDAGFTVWPFEDVRLPAAVEIWPRALTHAVVKTDRGARIRYLEDGVPELAPPLRGVAASGDDAFDAAVAAAVMWRNRAELRSLRRDPEHELEGRIWTPSAVVGTH